MRTLAAALVLLCASARAGTVADEATAQIKSMLPPELALVSLQVTGGDKPAGDVTVVWHGAPRPGPATVQVTGKGGTAWARIVLAAVGEVVVARRAIAAKEMIRPGDLVRESRPLANGKEMSLDPTYLDGAQAARPLAAGAVLETADLVLPPPVQKGSPVTVIIEIGSARISAAGVLERPARVGERTSVRLGSMARIVEGELTDLTTVRIMKGNR